MVKQFTKTEQDTADAIDEFLAFVPDQFQEKAQQLTAKIYRLVAEDCGMVFAADKVVEAVRKDLLDRSNVGIKKYGTTLADNKGNQRYWLNHAYEEALDLANYLKRSIMELDANGD